MYAHFIKRNHFGLNVKNNSNTDDRIIFKKSIIFIEETEKLI